MWVLLIYILGVIAAFFMHALFKLVLDDEITIGCMIWIAVSSFFSWLTFLIYLLCAALEPDFYDKLKKMGIPLVDFLHKPLITFVSSENKYRILVRL